MSTNKVDWAGEVATAVSAMKEEGAKAYTYLKQEAPEVGAEYVRWKMVESGTTVLACILFTAIIGYASKRLIKAGNELFGLWVVLLPFAALFLIVAFEHSAKFAKCLVAPRIVIIEGIKEVVR